jgi:adenylate cyclase
VAARKCGAPPAGSSPTPNCVAAVRRQTRARSQHYVDSAARRLYVLNINAWMAVLVCGGYGLVGLFSGAGASPPQLIDLAAATIFATVPLLHRFGKLVAPLTFVGASYVSIVVITWNVGTGNGLQFFLLVTACLVVLQLGIEHIALASTLAGVAAALVIALEFLVPRDTGVAPPWATKLGFVIAAVSACAMVVVTMWYALRNIARAEAAMEVEYERSEALLSNMLPASIAARLKDPERQVIADKYDDASVLFADIAGFTERASDTAPADLVTFLNRLYNEFDVLVDKHGLEKIKVSGDCYMVVSGVPSPRHDHVEALADLALDMAGRGGGLGRSARSGGAVAPGDRQRTGRRGCGRLAPILLRRLGRRGQRRVADGDHRRRGPYPSSRGGVRAVEAQFRLTGARWYRNQGQRRDAHLVSHRSPFAGRCQPLRGRSGTIGKRLSRVRDSPRNPACGTLRAWI